MKLPTTLNRADIDTPLGRMRLAASDSALVGVWFVDQKHAPDPLVVARWRTDGDHPVLRDAARQLAEYFAGRRQAFHLPLDLSPGTPFQQSVWVALQGIGPGRTLTYGELAQRLNAPRAVRAVAAAVGRNPLGIVVPCHRVLGAGGALTGYAGGLPRKAALLDLESGHAPIPA